MENRIPFRRAPKAWKLYSLAVFLPFAALLIRSALIPSLRDRAPYVGFIVAAALVAAVGGSRPGMVSTLLGAILALLFVFPEPGSFLSHKPVDYVATATFLITGCLVSVFSERVKKAATARSDVQFLYQQILNSIGDGVIAFNEHRQVCLMNPVAERLTGWTNSEAYGKPLDQVFQVAALGNTLLAPLAAEQDVPAESFEYPELISRSGDRTPIERAEAPIYDPDRGKSGTVLVVRNVRARRDGERERREARDALLRAQKLESIGILAGGVAHDFNNLLTGILGGTGLALDWIPPSHPAYPFLRNVLAASERANALTVQMLAYAGKGHILVEPVNLSEAVPSTVDAIRASIPNSVRLRLELAEDVPLVQADKTQIQQVIMNLIINGAEAIGEQTSGSVTVRTRAEKHSGTAKPCRFSGNQISPGEYAVLEVEDTGAGIDRAVLPRVFEPFFTTKFTGRGLGLAAVLGIIRINNGCIEITSEPGRGSTFRVLIPALVPGNQSWRTTVNKEL